MKDNVGVRTLSALVIAISCYLLLWQLLTKYFDFPVYYYGRLIEALALILFIVLAVITPMKFEEMGIVVPLPVLLRSLALGSMVSLLFVSALFVMQRVSVGYIDFHWYFAEDISQVTYFLVAPFQEILAKSVMLYGFELVFGKNHPYLAVLMSALTFAAFHVVYGIRMMVLAMLLSLVTGWMFYRERCVWGCAVAHFACGFFPVCLGF